MKTVNSFIKIKAWLFGFLVGLCLATVAHATVGFTNTPSAVSNTYSGSITLQVTGLTNTETVVVQKFLDVNADGLIDAGDLLVQQFGLTDGQATVIGGVTNINVPGDVDTTGGQITAQLNFQNGEFLQQTIGKYLFKLSSPGGHFTPMTNVFNVTNFPYAQKITGTVVNSGSNVPNAMVILFPPPRGGNQGPGTPVAEALADNSGSYTIRASAGSYVPLAIGRNYVANYATAPLVTLGNGQTINTDLTVTNATASISGTVVDAGNNSIGLPGLFLPAADNNGLIGVAFSDTNGGFTAPVTASQWNLEGEPAGLVLHGYVGYQNGTNADTSGGNVSGLTLAFPQATALFYGTVKDDLGNPLAGIDLYAGDSNNIYSADGYWDPNGNYVVGVLGLNNDPWQIQVSSDKSPGNYIFSQSASSQTGGTNLTVGTVVHQNFTALVAINQITGHVEDSNGDPISGVGVSAFATINGKNYQAQTDTDSGGDYSLNVANGDWSVNVNCNGGNDSLDGILTNGNYQCPNNQYVNIADTDGTADFTVALCGTVVITTTSPLPDGQVGSYYFTQFQASSCNSSFTWSVNDPQDLPPGLTMYSGGAFNGTPTNSGTYNFTVHVVDGNSSTADQTFSITINGSLLQITTTSLSNATQNAYYSATLTASGGLPPYNWSLAPGSASLPLGFTLTTNGVISGTPVNSGTNGFIVLATDATAAWTYQYLTLTVDPSAIPPTIVLGAPHRTSNGGFQFNLNTAAGVSYTIQYSTDLKNWNSLLTFQGSGGLMTIVDPNAAGNSRGFYRIKVGP